MPNYFSRYSAIIPMTEKGAHWAWGLNTLLMCNSGDEDLGEHGVDRADYPDDIVSPVVAKFEQLGLTDLDVSWQSETDGSDAASGKMIISNDWGDAPVECVALFVQSIMKKFDIANEMSFDWCQSCHVLQPARTGGTKATVSCDSISYETASESVTHSASQHDSSTDRDNGPSM